ncbi:MAG: DUF4382 domain-containing protein [Armatimonadetes bacterium]|nr:DUF4382 domain-containing protein [Armatimonadota bacterium]MDW8122683.1 DUF4382 domain-containing protein [Armatimonadota bacterium]
MRTRWALLLVAVTVAVAGCSGDSGPKGTLKVALTDQPPANPSYQQVVLSLREIRVVPAGSESMAEPGLPLIASLVPPRTIDILTLRFQQQLIGEATVPAGTYQQVRLILQRNQGPSLSNYVVLSGQTDRIPLETPSGHESGIKVLGRFEVRAGTLNAIALDFDPSKAIVRTGNNRYLIKPTGIRVVQMADILNTYGSLSGSVRPEGAWSSAIVTAYTAGTDILVASGSVNPDDGSFRLFLPDGTYRLVIRSSGFRTYDSLQLNPPLTYLVTSRADTSVGTVTLQSSQ